MAKTKTIEFEETTITIRSPSFGEMRPLASKIEELIQMETPIALVSSDVFSEVMDVVLADSESRASFYDDLDLQEAWDVWQGWLEFSRMTDFFAEAAASQQKLQQVLEEVNARGMQNRLDLMKKLGLVQGDFSLSDVLGQADVTKALQGASETGSSKAKPKAARKK